MKKLLLLIATSIISLISFATEQGPDYIIYEGNKFKISDDVYPLEKYFKIHPELREKIRISAPVTIDGEEVESFVICTALHRGYVAVLEAIDNHIHIKEILALNPDSEGSEFIDVIDKIFPDKESRKLEWLTTTLLLPYAWVIDWESDNRVRQYYSKYIVMHIQSGKIQSAVSISKDEYEKIWQVD